MIREIEDLHIWYYDSCTLKYICNDKQFFSDILLKSYKFVIAKKEIIRLEEVKLVYLHTNTGTTVTLKNVAYTPRYNFKLILLGQLQESHITYHHHPKYMILRQRKNSIRSTNKYKNLFILYTKTMDKKLIITQKKDQPIYHKSRNSSIRLWHRRFGHANNASIMQVLNLVDSIKLDNLFEKAKKDQYSSSDF